MKHRLVFEGSDGKLIKFTRDEVIRRFQLRGLRRLDGSELPMHLESFQLSKRADIELDGNVEGVGHPGDHVIIDQYEMFIIPDEYFKENYIRLDSEDSRVFTSKV